MGASEYAGTRLGARRTTERGKRKNGRDSRRKSDSYQPPPFVTKSLR
jgi:hypothetical protein